MEQRKAVHAEIAFSTDGGRTLQKRNEPCVPVIYRTAVTQKVYWHEESGAYIMALWLRGNDFGILRSEDLENWDLVDEFTLKDGWECRIFFSYPRKTVRKTGFLVSGRLLLPGRV